MPGKKIYIREFSNILSAQFIGRAATFGTNLIAATILSVEHYGQFAFLRQTIGLVESILVGSIRDELTINTVKHASRDPAQSGYVPDQLWPGWRDIAVFLSVLGVLSLATIEGFQRAFVPSLPQLDLNLTVVAGIFCALTISCSVGTIVLIAAKKSIELVRISTPVALLLVPVFWLSVVTLGQLGGFAALAIVLAADLRLKWCVGTPRGREKGGILQNANLFAGMIRRNAKVFIAVITSAAVQWQVRLHSAGETHSWVEIASLEVSLQFYTVLLLISGVAASISTRNLAAGTPSKNVSVADLIQVIRAPFLFTCFAATPIVLFGPDLLGKIRPEYGEVRSTIILVCVLASLVSVSSATQSYLTVRDRRDLLLIGSLVAGGITLSTLWFSDQTFSGSQEMAFLLVLHQLILISTQLVSIALTMPSNNVR